MKISRAITSSFSWPCISGPTGRPALDSCAASMSTRALGTGLPLTIATFCAATGRAMPTMAAATAVRRTFFMGFALETDSESGWGALDRQSMDPTVAVDIVAQGIIHKAVAGHPRAAGEQGRGNPYAEMRAGARAVLARVAKVLGAFVHYLQARGRE